MRRSSGAPAGPAASLRGSALSRGLRGGLRASRLRRASAGAHDVARRAAGYRPGYDPLALVRRLPPTLSSFVSVKAGRAIKAFVPAPSDTFVAQLRGGVVVLVDPMAAPPVEAMDVSQVVGDVGDGTRALSGVDLAAVDPTTGDVLQPILGLFSVRGLDVTRSTRPGMLRMRRPGDPHNVWLKFANEATAHKWEKTLRAVARERVPRVSDFEFIAPIGKGASGKVWLALDRATGKRCALKVVPKQRVFETRSGFRHALDERLALQAVAGHPFFTQLTHAFQTRSNLYFVLEFYGGGDLYQFLRNNGGRLAESQVRAIVAEVAVAMEFLHGKGFVYRDLKTENVLLGVDGHVRLADFGLSKYLPPSDPLTATICGTHTFASVEMLAQRHYGKSVDFWALGIFTFYLLNGRTPFEAQDLDRVIQKLNKRVIRFKASTSPELVGFVKRLLDWQTNTRLGCGPRGWTEVKEHAFLADVDWHNIGRNSLYDYGAKPARTLASHPVPKPSRRAPASPSSPAATPVKPKQSSAPLPPSSPVTPSGEASSASSASLPAPAPARKPGATYRPDDDLQNFDVSLWRDTVSIDDDADDPAYNRALWPLRSARKHLADPCYVVGWEASVLP